MNEKNPKESNSISVLDLNESKLAFIKEKMSNPFWIPKNSSDLFYMRDLLKQQKHSKKKFLKTQTFVNSKNESSFKNFSNKQLPKFQSLSKKRFENSLNKTANNKFQRGEFNDYSEIQGQMITSDISSTNRLLVNSFTKNSNKKIEDEELLSKKIRDCQNFRARSVKDYMEKTRDFINLKYSLNVKEERIVRIKETNNNEIEAVKDSMEGMIAAKNNFENEFCDKFFKYLKFLSLEKEKEKKVLSLIIDEKNNLDGQIRFLENKIYKQKERLVSFQEFKLFILSVKDKKRYFLKKKGNTSLLNQNIPKLEKNESLVHGSFYLTAASYRSKVPVKFRTIKANKNDDEEYISQSSLTEKKEIFSSTEELVDSLKMLEQSNIELLGKFNSLTQTFQENLRELKLIQSEDINSNNAALAYIQRKTRELEELKSRNNRLLEEKEKLSKSTYFKQKSHKYKNYDVDYTHKIAELFKNCRQDFFYEENTQISEKIQHKAILNKNSHLEMLKFCEKTFEYLHSKFDFYFKNHFSEIKLIEKETEKDRKKKIAESTKNESEKKAGNLKSEIFNRYNKIIVKPLRKVATRSKPKDEKRRQFVQSVNDEAIDFFDLLYYD